MSKTPEHLMWIDLESTGLDDQLDEIIEVGAVVTDLDLNILGDFETIVLPTWSGWERLRNNTFVTEMHLANGLQYELVGASETEIPGPFIADAERGLLVELDEIGLGDASFYLAGSGVSHFDDDMLAHWMPTLFSRLHYAAIDMGTMRRFYKMSTGSDLVTVNDDKTHRSMDDVRCHLAEARAFRAMFRRIGIQIADGLWLPPSDLPPCTVDPEVIR
ncbi:MAG: exonuclease domain-containing protein [Actinomycetota bacterium]|nr:exonuclease domain-containing protein [Actinomycetota bacterium]